ncbi:hypothetical protein [Streptomyces sp. NPDC093990]|uniref:hypothetical protein n=1 Tax=Streptomyces sp. NPDC093990 TaxID=3155306 RepID=UPI003428E182
MSRYDRAWPPGAAPRARTAGRSGPDTEDGLSALRCNTRADNVLAAAVDVGAGVDCALGPVSGTGVGAAGVGIEGSPCEAFVPFIQGAD